MATLGQAKTLGGVGSILLLLTPIPYVGAVLAIVGFIMILVAVKYVADVLGDQKIFNNMIIAVVLAIVGIIVFVITVLSAIFSIVGLRNYTYPSGTTVPSGLFAAIATILLGLFLFWIFYLVASIFLKRSYDSIAARLNVGTFHTTGLLYLIGAATTIIFIGFIIVFIAQILQIVSFFSIPEQMPMGPQPMPGQMGPPPPPPGTMSVERRE